MTDPSAKPYEPALTQGSVLRGTIRFGLPMAFGMAFHSLFNLVDIFIVGKLGEEAVAAATIASQVTLIPMVICNGISTSSIAMIARNIGFGNLRRANEIARQSIVLTVVLSFVLGLPLYLYARQVTLALHAGPGVVGPATEYLEVMSIGTISMFMLMQTTAILRAEGESFWPMMIFVVANVLNILLDYALVLGEWGFPDLGAPGAAWATVIARVIGSLMGLAVLIVGPGMIRLTWRRFRLRLGLQLAMLRIGFPTALQWVIRSCAYLVLFWMLGELAAGGGEDYLGSVQAAFGVGIRLEVFAVFTGFGWGAAASTMVGQSLGRGLPDRAERAAWVAIVLNAVTMIGLAVVYYLFAPALIEFFVEGEPDPKYVEVGVEFLQVVVFSYPLMAISVVLSHAMNGAGSTKSPLAIDAVGLILIQLPLAWILAHRPEYGIRGVWYAIVLSQAVMALIYVMRFRTGRWKEKIVR